MWIWVAFRLRFRDFFFFFLIRIRERIRGAGYFIGFVRNIIFMQCSIFDENRILSKTTPQ